LSPDPEGIIDSLHITPGPNVTDHDALRTLDF